MLKSVLILLSIPVWLLGCSLHQPQQFEPGILLPEQYVEQTGPARTDQPMDRWWLAFNDPQLNRLMEQLFADNLQLEEAFARLEQTQAVVQITASSRWPSLGIGGQASREQVPGFTQDAQVTNYRFSAQSNFEVDLWGKLKNRQIASELRAEASQNQLQTLYLGLSAQLADLYYFAVEQRAQLKLTEQTISSYRDTLVRVESRYRQGLVPAIDLYQARQSLSAAETSQPRFIKNLRTAEHGIAALLGNYPDQGTAGSLATLPSLEEHFTTGLPADLLQRRPDVAASFKQLRAADEEVAAAIADRLPSLNLAANYGLLQNDFGIGAITGNFWQLLIQPTIPLLDGGRRKAEVVRNRAIVRERLAAYQQVILNAFREVEDALIANRTEDQRIKHLSTTVNATAASLRLALQNYLYGVNDYLPVLTAQRNDFLARSELLASHRQLLSDRTSLARALGGTWMNQEIDLRFTSREELKNHE